MIPVLLTSIKTRDGITLEGIIRHPKGRKGTALIWVHGLTSRFSSGQNRTKAISDACVRNGIGFFNFNTRGHDIVSGGGKQGKFVGAGFENFKESIHDIHAVILAAKHLGYKNIILAGHSTGANKVVYYLYKKRNRLVKGLILMGALSDISAEHNRVGIKAVTTGVKIAERLYVRDKNALMPARYGVYSVKRYLSLFRAGSAEHTFPYHSERAKWKELRSIRVPLAVIFGSRDEHFEHPWNAKSLLEIFRSNANSAKSFSGFVIPYAGHGFKKKEKELASVMIRWIKKHI